MEYIDLSLEERINRAAEFSIILSAEPNKTPDQVIIELSQTFSLTPEQATQAYNNSKIKFAAEYTAANKSKMLFYLSAFLGLTVIGIFYFFLTDEIGSNVFIFLPLFFIISAIGIINLALKSVSENFLLKYSLLKAFKSNILVQLFPAVLIFFGAALFQFFFTHVIQKDDISYRSYVLNSPVTLKKTGGRSPQKYYAFGFDGFEKEFRFYQSDCQYISQHIDFENMNIGDTITIGLVTNDLKNLNKESFFSGSNQIISFVINGHDIINYTNRSNEKKKNFSFFLKITSAALAINILLIYLFVVRKKRNVVS